VSDLTIDIGARDQASDKFRQVGRAAEEAGKKLKDTGDKGKDSSDKLSKGWLAAGAAIGAMVGAAHAAVDFLKMGIAEYAKAEQSNLRLAAAARQLGYDAAALVPALNAQAQAFEESSLAQGEQIASIQELLLRFGVAPRDIGKTTQAILDYSTVSGKDAVSAANALMKATQGEGEEMSAFGVSVERTGDRTNDLNGLVEKMTDQFGGAAKAATEGMAGSMDRLQKSQEDLSKAFAGFLAKTGLADTVMKGLSTTLKNTTALLTGDVGDMGVLSDGQLRQASINKEKFLMLQWMREKDVARKKELMAQVVHVRLERAQMDKEAAALEQGASNQAQVIAAGSGKKVKATEDGGKRLLKAMKKIADDVERERKELAQDLEMYNEAGRRLEEDLANRRVEAMMSARDREDAEWQRAMGHTRNRAGQLSVAMSDNLKDDGQPAMYDAGIAIGSAFLDGLDAQLENLAQGGEMDMGQVFAALIPLAVQFALTQAGVPEPIAAIGGKIAGIGVKYGMNEVSGGGKKAKNPYRSSYHSGGWVDEPPRYHAGSWALGSDEETAILQRGERVLSRREVQGMGGPGAVDSAARGSGGSTVYVSTLDAQSFTDFLGQRGGSGFSRALRENRGVLPEHLRRLVRRGR
jgi:hypothetical protein